MSKELEAFEDLKRQVGNMPYTSYDNGLGNRTTFLIKDSAIFPLIENALKKYELMKTIEEWLSKIRFYGKALNEPNKILELKFYKLEIRPEEDLLLIYFEVLNNWGANIFYNILSYGRSWALTKEELL